MGQVLSHPAAACRHLKHGRCSNHFWKIMQQEGKPGLARFICVLWQAKLEAVEQYRQAAWRAARFGREKDEQDKTLAWERARDPAARVSCPDHRPDPDRPHGQCRYFFLEVCLLTFPLCREPCPDFLPQGEQRRP